jgi:hypothetical protein
MAKQSNLEKQRVNEMKTGRDKKVHEHLLQYAPVWLVKEEPVLDRDALYFNVVFLHPTYGWVNRHYSYDVVTDVLYHSGQQLVIEDDALEIQATEPYITASGINTVQSYGG